MNIHILAEQTCADDLSDRGKNQSRTHGNAVTQWDRTRGIAFGESPASSSAAGAAAAMPTASLQG